VQNCLPVPACWRIKRHSYWDNHYRTRKFKLSWSSLLKGRSSHRLHLSGYRGRLIFRRRPSNALEVLFFPLCSKHPFFLKMDLQIALENSSGEEVIALLKMEKRLFQRGNTEDIRSALRELDCLDLAHLFMDDNSSGSNGNTVNNNDNNNGNINNNNSSNNSNISNNSVSNGGDINNNSDSNVNNNSSSNSKKSATQLCAVWKHRLNDAFVQSDTFSVTLYVRMV